jgi:hypothetical protein
MYLAGANVGSPSVDGLILFLFHFCRNKKMSELPYGAPMFSGTKRRAAIWLRVREIQQ